MDDSPAQLALTHYSRALWIALVPELPAEVEYLPCGTIWVAADDEELAECHRKKALAPHVRMEVIDARQLAEAEPHLRECYEQVYALYPPEYAVEVPAVQRPAGGSDSIVASHSLIPEALRHVFAAYGVLLSADLPLSRRQHEMIATVVSALNRCFY